MPSDLSSQVPRGLRPVRVGGYADAVRPQRVGGTVKRAFDLGLALCLVPIVLPVVAVFWLILRLEGGAGFFRHTRVGHRGRAFGCLKLRTMVPDAETKLAAVLARDPTARAEWDRDAKLRNDPRVTRFGRFLRKTSLDELPQLLNVLRGEMSFVGPRPVPADELRRYGPQADAYLSQRPGITGLWQVSGRNDLDYAARVRLDRRYAETRSFWMDLGILARTVGVVLRRTGL